MARRKTAEGDAHTRPAILVFALDEDGAKTLERQFTSILSKKSGSVTISSRFVPAYVGEFVGWCVSVALGEVAALAAGAPGLRGVVLEVEPRRRERLVHPAAGAETVATEVQVMPCHAVTRGRWRPSGSADGVPGTQYLRLRLWPAGGPGLRRWRVRQG